MSIFFELSAIFILVALIFTFFVIYLIRDTHSMHRRCTKETEGVVIGYKQSLAPRHNAFLGDDTNTPITKYTVDGKEYFAHSGFSSTSKLYDIGQKVTIKYNPKFPNESYIKTDNEAEVFIYLFTGVTILCYLLGIIFLVIGFLMLNK